MYKIEFLKEAYKEFKNLDRAVQRIIKEKLDLLAENPEALKNNIRLLCPKTEQK